MKQKFLESAEDLAWLAEVHKVDVSGVACAILHGNEDSPSKVETYTVNHIDCLPVTWKQDADGIMRKQTV